MKHEQVYSPASLEKKRGRRGEGQTGHMIVNVCPRCGSLIMRLENGQSMGTSNISSVVVDEYHRTLTCLVPLSIKLTH